MRFGVGLMVPDSGWPSGEIGFWWEDRLYSMLDCFNCVGLG
jgi:hypothetical protein